MNRDLRERNFIYRSILHKGSAGPVPAHADRKGRRRPQKMKFTDDELVILMIYAEETRGKTIESIRGMIYRTAIDETELREMGNSAIRKLEQMTDEEYEDMDIYDISDAL